MGVGMPVACTVKLAACPTAKVTALALDAAAAGEGPGGAGRTVLIGAGGQCRRLETAIAQPGGPGRRDDLRQRRTAGGDISGVATVIGDDAVGADRQGRCAAGGGA